MKKIWKSNITGEILFLLGVILLWQILYMIGVDMESLCDAVTNWCVEFIYGNDKAGNLAIGNWEQFTTRGNRIYSFPYDRRGYWSIYESFFIFT